MRVSFIIVPLKIFMFILFCPLMLASQTYCWDNVAVGGGGYIVGMAIHPENPDLIYLRTDVGGVYKWDPQDHRMKQLMNWIPFEESNLYGTAGIALDPSNQNIVYLASGKYKGASPSDVLKSVDAGKSWTRMNLNKTFGGNSHPNRKGSPLAVNPHNTDEVWAGTMGDGLWKYVGKNWIKVENIPAGESVRAVVFDPNNPNFVYIAVRGEGVFRSVDSGKTFRKVGEAPTTISDMSLSKDGDILYISAWDKGIHKLSNARTSETWEDISAPDLKNRTVTASLHENETVMTFGDEYGALDQFNISTDAGNSWERKKGKVDRHIPWHPPTFAGSAVSQIAFDPKDPKKVYFTDWYSFYFTQDWTTSPVLWNNAMGIGHEEIVTAVLSPAHPENSADVLFYSGSADVGGFSHTALRSFPTANFKTLVSIDKNFNEKTFTEVTGIDFAESDPDFVAVVGGSDWDGTKGSFGYSLDGGVTFHLSAAYQPEWGDGRIAISGKNKNNLVVVTQQGIKYSSDAGSSFSEARGAPDVKELGIGGIFNYRMILASDRVNNNFYLYSLSGNFFRSIDGGKSFKVAGSLPGTSSKKIYLKGVPEQGNQVWAALGEEGLWRSEDGGKSWSKLNMFREVSLLAFGKEAPGTSFPAVYVWGKLQDDSEYWFYRSIDEGKSWERINDAENRVGNSTQALAADRKVFGRVYVGTNGSGIWYGEPLNSSGK